MAPTVPSAPLVFLILGGAGWAGTERHVRSLLQGLSARGWSLHLITSQRGPLVDEANALGVAHSLCPRPNDLVYLLALRKLLRQTRPALVHAHSGRLACLAARWAGVPRVLETHHGIPERLRWAYHALPALSRWERGKNSLTDRTICVCQSDADWMECRAAMPRDRLRVIPNGLPLSEDEDGRTLIDRRAEARRRWHLPEDAPLLGFVGRIAPQKAPARFLELLSSLREQHDVRGVVCGAGPRESSLRDQAARTVGTGAIHWLGETHEGRSVIRALDLLVLPSLWEGAPYTVLEALAEGTPLLATPVGGVPEILSGGSLAESVADWSRAGWTDRAGRLLFDPSARGEWQRAARSRIRDFSEEQMLRSVEDTYQEVLRG